MYVEAEKMHLQVLKLNEKLLGAEHLSTFSSMTNLSKVLDSQGKYDDAEKMNRRALEGYRKVQGEEASLALMIKNGLAGVLISRQLQQG